MTQLPARTPADSRWFEKVGLLLTGVGMIFGPIYQEWLEGSEWSEVAPVLAVLAEYGSLPLAGIAGFIVASIYWRRRLQGLAPEEVEAGIVAMQRRTLSAERLAADAQAHAVEAEAELRQRDADAHDIDTAYRRGAYFSADFSEHSYVDRAGHYVLRLVLLNSSPFRPQVGRVVARNISIDGRPIERGELELKYERGAGVGDPWGDAEVNVYIEGDRFPVPDGRASVHVEFFGLRVWPRDKGVEWEHPAQLRTVRGNVHVADA